MNPAPRSAACAHTTRCGCCTAARRCRSPTPQASLPSTSVHSAPLSGLRLAVHLLLLLRQVEFALRKAHGDVVGKVRVDLRVVKGDLDRKAVEQCSELKREHPGVDLGV